MEGCKRWMVWFLVFIFVVNVSVTTEEHVQVDSAKYRKALPISVIYPSTTQLPEKSIGGAYGGWSEWSRCSRRCKQVRTRTCANPAACGSKVQKHFRACHTSNCKQKLLTVVPNKLDSDPSSRDNSEFRVILHWQQNFYSEWSKWSPCSNSCYTRRVRACKFHSVCGKDTVQEEYNVCYHEGDLCEQMYLEKQQHLAMIHNMTREHVHSSSGSLLLNSVNCGISEVNPDMLTKIIGGRKAARDSWPWQVLILNKFGEPFCGGALLASNWILTAAHCVRRRLYVRAGEYDLSEIEGTEQEERVQHTFVHPDYDPETVDNDLALLKLRMPLELNRNVFPVCLPQPEDELHLFARGIILGWGKRRNEAAFGTDVLHQAEVPVVSTEKCQSSYDDYFISSNMLCAGYDVGRVDSCAGDSGGPFLYKRDDGTWAVYGITSFGEGCGQKGKYGVYASVPNYVPWIRGIVEKYQ